MLSVHQHVAVLTGIFCDLAVLLLLLLLLLLLAGLISYRKYWTEVIIECLDGHNANSISLQDISVQTSLNIYDIIRCVSC